MKEEKAKSELSKSLEVTISKSDLKTVGSELLEVGIDQILAEGILKEIPIINVISGLCKTGIAIRDSRFISKLLHFLNESSKLTDSQREKIIENLEDDEYQKEAGEKLLSIIDNLETNSKAILVGKTLYLFGNKSISKEDFWRICFIIEKLPINDINALKNWRSLNLNKVEHIRKHLYLSVGLGWFVLDSSSTGFVWTESLCEIFSDKLL